MSGHQPKPSDEPLGTPPTGGSGATNPERDLTIRIEAMRAVVGLFGGRPYTGQLFTDTLRYIEIYLRTGERT